KTLLASEQQRADVRQARELWIGRRKRLLNKALARLIFIDETSTNSKLTKRTCVERRSIVWPAINRRSSAALPQQLETTAGQEKQPRWRKETTRQHTTTPGHDQIVSQGVV
ncbi:hypothetical protein NKI99_33415, partial [Mesorhizobium sp. M0239]